MYRSLQTILTLLLALAISGTLYAQPANDMCENASPITELGTYEFTNLDATTDPSGFPTNCDIGGGARVDSLFNDIWYTYTATFTGTLEFSTCGMADFDTNLAIYGPDAPCQPTEDDVIACSEDAPGCSAFSSSAFFDVVQGETYLLRIGGWGPGEAGGGTFSLTDAGAVPENDDCANAIEILGTQTQVRFNTLGATTDGPDHPNDCVSAGSTGEVLYNDIWYLWTPNFSGEAEFSTCNTANFDTKIAVYAAGAACPPTDDDLIGCNEDGQGCDNFTSVANFNVTAGESYLLRLGGFGDGAPGESGVGTFSITPAGPENDLCENAIELDLGEEDFVEIEFDNTLATTSPPQHVDAQACFEDDEEFVYKDLWYRWTADFTGALEFSTCGIAFFDTRLAVYASTTCPPDTSTLVGCGDDDVDENAVNCPGFTSRALFNVEEGTTYLFRLGGWGTSPPGSSGTGTFIVNRIPPLVPPANDNCTQNVPVSVLTLEQADDFLELNEGFTANASPQPSIPNPSCDSDGEFWDVWYSFNSGPNTELNLRFNKITTNADFIIDLYTDCRSQAVLEGGGTFCTLTEGLAENFINVPITGLPGEPTDYLLRVSSNVRDVAPGEFWFQLVGETAVSTLDELAVEDFRLFPNPVRDLATVSFNLKEATDGQVEILNTLGQVVQRENFGQIASGKNRFEVSTAKLERGIYFFRFLAEGKQKTVRFVKE